MFRYFYFSFRNRLSPLHIDGRVDIFSAGLKSDSWGLT
jgi:hypothetical protein